MVKINASLTKHLKIKANIYNEIVKMNLFLHKNKSLQMQHFKLHKYCVFNF